MMLEKRVIFMDDGREKFLYNRDDIFNKLKEILNSIKIYFVTHDSGRELCCICGILKVDDVIKIIRNKINSPLIVFDTYIDLYENNGNLFIIKR